MPATAPMHIMIQVSNGGGGGEKAPSFCEVLTQQYIKGLAADCNSGEWT